MDNMKVSDQLSLKDKFTPGLWARTEVICGYGDIIRNPNGKSTLPEVLFTTHNMVPIGGVSYVLSRVFGIDETQLHIPTLYEEKGIGLPDSAAPSETYPIPGGTGHAHYRHGHFAQLFGVGITGSAENDITLYHPDYREKSIELSRVGSDGLTIEGTMLPFRYTATDLDANEKLKYFGKKTESDVTAYYLKRFESEVEIHHIWKTGDDVDTEVEVTPEEVWNLASTNNAVESFAEINIKIDKKDVKEYFAYIGQEDRARINTLALFTGEYANSGQNYDYRDVRLFSKVCIKPEYLNISKDLNFIYRVYGA